MYKLEGGLKTKGLFNKKSIKEKPLIVSIVTPVYNGERYLKETIESIIYQRGYFEIEYIIVDGASSDKTISIVKKYQDMLNSGECLINCEKVSITFISEKDEGMYHALVKGFKLATGDIVAYVNSDDFYLPNAFSTVVDIFLTYPEVEWLTGMPVNYNEKGQIIGCFLPFNYNVDLIRKGIYGPTLVFIQQESIFWRAKLLNFLDFTNLKNYKFAGDFYMWYTFSKHTDFYIVQSCLGGFRGHRNQLSKQRSEYYREFYSIAEKKTFLDITKAYLYKVATYFLPNRIKRKLNRKIIYYYNGKWIKENRKANM
jgi:glycosyltransferase involved in cell wall biosynthesis